MINGEILKQAVISGAHNISVQKNHINDLNIFPVPDGDTGTNMSMTIMAAAKALEDYDGTNAGEVAEMTASSMLRGARGNSGVITSILFRGFAQGLKGMEEVNGKNIAAALGIGVEAAYKAVMKPTEGTILTVARIRGCKARHLRAPCMADDHRRCKRRALNHSRASPRAQKGGCSRRGRQGPLLDLRGNAQLHQGRRGC